MQENLPNFEDDQDLYEHHRFQADPGQGLIRIDKFLMMRMEHVSRNRIQAAAAEGLIQVNNLPVKSSYRVKPGDVIRVMMPEPKKEFKLIAEDIPIDIVFEDEDLIVVNKPAGMVVHPAFGNYTGTLVNALLFHLREAMENQPETAPFLVHRIDKNTSGLLLVAKNEKNQTGLQRQFFHHTIQRKYDALVWGDVETDQGTISGNIARSKSDRKIFTVYDDPEIGKNAVTHYSVKERFGYVTRVECRLETGRTHQIRVHMKHLGHPLFNDETYGGNRILRGTKFSKYKQFVENCFTICPRQALHAVTLGFEHPRTGKPMHFEAPLPDDLSHLIEKWRKYAVHKFYRDE
jgi:23S rRNA pseudouridine1911/1915/1917 synthase